MKLFRRSVELVVIRNIFDKPPLDINGNPIFETYHGRDIEDLLRQAFGDGGLSSSVHIYHGSLTNNVTPKTEADVDRIMRLSGRFYAIVKPMGILNKAVNIFMEVTGIGWLMKQLTPEIPNVGTQTAAPSPNNALAARTNQQRLGGRVPDIFGTVWSVPDLIAPTYSVYIDNREVEMSYMCVGRGRFDVRQALDDTTPVNQVAGSSVYIYDPDDTLDDEPDFIFGSVFTPDEAALSRLAVKRYTSVNGQVLPPPDRYSVLTNVTFRHPNKVDLGSNSISSFKVGAEVNLEQASDMASVNGVVDEFGNIVKYNLSGRYIVQSISGKVVTLDSPEMVNPEWQKLADNTDEAVASSMAASVESDTLWQGWFYTNSTEHEYAMLNVVANNGLYNMTEGLYESLGIVFTVETELVDVNNNAISGTLEQTDHTLFGNKFKIYSGGGSGGLFRGVRYSGNSTRNKDDERAATAAGTFIVTNSSMGVGKRMRMRVRRKSYRVDFGETQQASQEIKISDFYGVKQITASDCPKGVTTVYAKTLATEGALSLKERKLRLLVQRYVTDATSGLLKLSNRADDIIRHIATDPKIGNLQLSQIDIAQIRTEIDAQVAYFGTEKCSEFCYTFDDNNLSAEEMLQTVGKAVFSQAKRQGNKIMLDFERIVPASVAVFNSHNILPDTFTASESLGIANDYDGVTVEYTDPTDDATVTLSYPDYSLVNPHEDKLIGVRNQVQAHMHMMRLYNKDRRAYKTCEFTAGDESNIVVRTNRITVADQLRANIQQGSVDSIETVGSDIVLYTTDPVSIEPSVPHTLFIQTINNGVEAIEVTAHDDYSVKLARLPSGEISTGYDKVVQATYQIVTEEDKDRDAYLVSQKDPSEAMNNKLICTNYDDRYYQNDTDYINGLIT